MPPATQTEKSVNPRELHRRMTEGRQLRLVDVRTPGEFATGHVAGAKLIPLDELDAEALCRERSGDFTPLYVLCQFGGRATKAIEKLERAGVRGCVLLEGGTQAWVDAGLPVEKEASRVIPLMRQVQIVVGFVSALGSLLALTVHPFFALMPLVMGSGLMFAGLTGICGLALILAKMPWNKSASCKSGTCCSSEPK